MSDNKKSDKISEQAELENHINNYIQASSGEKIIYRDLVSLITIIPTALILVAIIYYIATKVREARTVRNVTKGNTTIEQHIVREANRHKAK